MLTLPDTMQTLYNATRIPLVLTNSAGTQTTTWPAFPVGYIAPRYVQLLLADFMLQKRDAAHPMVMYVEPGYFVGVAQLEQDEFCLLGPVAPTHHSRTEVLRFCSEAVSAESLQNFCNMLLTAPLVDFIQLRGLICLLLQLAKGLELPPEDVLLCNNTAMSQLHNRVLADELFRLREANDFHVPAEFEEEVCAAVQTGNNERLVKQMFTSAPGHVGVMSPNALRQIRYTFVSFITLVTRAAIRGGMLPETAYSLSDLYCQRMDLLTDASGIEKLFFTAAQDYCTKVRQLQNTKELSPAIRRCLDHISLHLHEPIRLGDLAKIAGLCTRSVSLRFKKEVGQSITDYIHTQRIEEAKYLLEHSAYTLAEISTFLQYPSQSYFTQIFKRRTGTTPQQYRDFSN